MNSGSTPGARAPRVAAATLAALLALTLAPPALRGPAPAAAATLQQTAPPAGGAEMGLAEVAARARPSVVDILVDNGSGGSGVRVGAGVITNAHVVADATAVELTLHDGTKARATVERSDAGYDLALLRTDADLPALELEPAAAQRQGDTVLALGYPALGGTSLSRGVTLTRGIIAAVREDADTGTTVIQTDAVLSAGSSGGALLNLRGRLIGIPAYSLGETPGLNFAVAADTVQAFLNGQPSKQPVARNLSAFLVPAAELGPNYEGTVQRAGPRDREAYAYADSPTGPSVVQAVQDAGDAAGAAREADEAGATALEEGATELRMAVTAGKRVFVNYSDGAQEMGVVAVKGQYVAVLFLDFAGLEDDGKRTELAVRFADQLLARIPG
jgi:S1-C subfamily serine protease